MNPLVIKWFSVGRGKIIQKSLLLLTNQKRINGQCLRENTGKLKACSSQ